MLADPAARWSIPAGTEPTIRSALEIYDQGWEGSLRACATLWQQVAQPSAAAEAAAPAGPRRKARSGCGASGNSNVSSAGSEVSATTDPWLGNHAGAAQKAGEAAAQLATAGETEHATFWCYVAAHAHFDPGRPQDLAAARRAL